MLKQLRIIALAAVLPQAAIAVPTPDGVFAVTPVLERTCIAVRVPVSKMQALAGITWYNNDGASVFPKVLVASGLADLPPLYADGVVAATNVTGEESQWSELVFAEPVGSESSSLYVIFQLPDGRECVGGGDGPGIGYAATDDVACVYVSDDGDEWSQLATGYRLLVDPVYTERTGGMLALKSSRGDGEAEPGSEIPEVVVERTELLQPYPNPFNPSATVGFTMLESGPAEVTVYDLRGRAVKVLASGQFDAGRHEIVWRGDDSGGRRMASGVYFVRMKAVGVDQIKRAVLVK